jgi:hypothetical protein
VARRVPNSYQGMSCLQIVSIIVYFSYSESSYSIILIVRSIVCFLSCIHAHRIRTGMSCRNLCNIFLCLLEATRTQLEYMCESLSSQRE